MLLLCILKIFNLLSLMKSDCQQNDAAPETDTALQSLFLAQSLGSNLSQNINNSACTASFKWTSHLFVPFHPPVYHAGCQNTTQMGKYQGQENTKMYERCLCWSMHRHKDMAFNVFSFAENFWYFNYTGCFITYLHTHFYSTDWVYIIFKAVLINSGLNDDISFERFQLSGF